jgi:hypothetical protein
MVNRGLDVHAPFVLSRCSYETQNAKRNASRLTGLSAAGSFAFRSFSPLLLFSPSQIVPSQALCPGPTVVERDWRVRWRFRAAGSVSEPANERASESANERVSEAVAPLCSLSRSLALSLSRSLALSLSRFIALSLYR